MNKIDKALLLLPSWLLTIAVVMAVLYLTLFPDPVPDMDVELFPDIDKVVHTIMMFGVYICIALDLMRHDHNTIHRLGIRACVLIFVVVSAFGGGIELLQSSMNLGRGCELPDFWADMAGALFGWIIVRLSPWPHQQLDADRHLADRG